MKLRWMSWVADASPLRHLRRQTMNPFHRCLRHGDPYDFPHSEAMNFAGVIAFCQKREQYTRRWPWGKIDENFRGPKWGWDWLIILEIGGHLRGEREYKLKIGKSCKTLKINRSILSHSILDYIPTCWMRILANSLPGTLIWRKEAAIDWPNHEQSSCCRAIVAGRCCWNSKDNNTFK